jgi:hypothetical protein
MIHNNKVENLWILMKIMDLLFFRILRKNPEIPRLVKELKKQTRGKGGF